MKTTITKPLYALLLLLTVCLGLHAQKIEEFTFSHIGQADGMHSQRIYSVVQTSDGALWWSSKHGVELAYKWTKDMLTVFKTTMPTSVSGISRSMTIRTRVWLTC